MLLASEGYDQFRSSFKKYNKAFAASKTIDSDEPALFLIAKIYSNRLLDQQVSWETLEEGENLQKMVDFLKKALKYPLCDDIDSESWIRLKVLDLVLSWEIKQGIHTAETESIYEMFGRTCDVGDPFLRILCAFSGKDESVKMSCFRRIDTHCKSESKDNLAHADVCSRIGGIIRNSGDEKKNR